MVKVLLNEFKNVQNFVHLADGLMSEVDAVSGRYVVNAKSIMGMLSLDFSQPIEIYVKEVIPSEKVQFENQLKNLGWVVE